MSKNIVAYAVDLSHWNGSVNFKKVKAAGYSAVILKAGGSDGGFYKDVKFESYYKDAKLAGLNVGAYYYVGKKCTSAKDGEADAKRFVNLLSDKQFEYPVYIDFEATTSKTKSGNTEACVAFCRYMESKGYFTGIYSSDIAGFNEMLDLSKLTDFSLWVARYGKAPQIVKDFAIWQYSCTGRVSGIGGDVDLDKVYVDFPSIIKKKHFNGF